MADCVTAVLTSYFANVKTWIGHLTHQLRDRYPRVELVLRNFSPRN